MSYLFYKWLHLSSLFIMILTTGLLIGPALLGIKLDPSLRKKFSAVHGTTLFLVLFAGFGLLAKAGLQNPWVAVWFWTKLAVWLSFGALPAFTKRCSQKALMKIFIGYALFLVLTVYMVLFKPF